MNAVAESDVQGVVERVVVTFTQSPYDRTDIRFKDIVDSAQDVILITQAQPLDEPGPRVIYALAPLVALLVRVVVHGPDSCILHANRRALALLRLTAEQALGKAVPDFQWRS